MFIANFLPRLWLENEKEEREEEEEEQEEKKVKFSRNGRAGEKKKTKDLIAEHYWRYLDFLNKYPGDSSPHDHLTWKVRIGTTS